VRRVDVAPHYGAPDWEVEGWITSYVAVSTGEMDVVSDVVHRLTGHEPQELEAFLRAHPELWSHLVKD
jgi:NAD(P)H dehydrogenase (quinone)